MERNQLEKYLHKKIKLILKCSYHFSGIVKSVNNHDITLLDKNSERLIIQSDQIAAVIEVSDNPRPYEGGRKHD